MHKKPSQEDPSSNWPEDVKKAYEQLAVPSLYDCILANEKLSLEIRKQGKDIRMAAEELQAVHSKLNTLVDIFNEELEIYEEDDDDDDEDSDFEDSFSDEFTDLEWDLLGNEQTTAWENTKTALMETADHLYDLSKATKQIVNQLLNSLPKAGHRAVSEELAQSLIERVDDVRYKLMMKLQEWNIQIIEPQSGESFNAQKHHALEYITGGVTGTIARVVRPGYEREGALFRSADVVVYS